MPGSNGCSNRRTSTPAVKSSSTAIVPRTSRLSMQGWRSWATQTFGDTSMVGPCGQPIRPCRLIVSRTTTSSSILNGCSGCSTEGGRKPRRPASSCSSTSTSGFRRSTRRITSPGRCISTRTGWRVPRTGTAGRRRRSRRPCARLESRTTRRSFSTAAIPKETRTRSGRDVERGRSPPVARR